MNIQKVKIMKNKIIILVSFITFFFIANSFTIKTNDATIEEFTMHDPTNLKVLPKDIDMESLKVIMKSFNSSLGVKCGFCHAPTADGKDLDFASDDNKHKEIARGMMIMTNEINQKYFALHPQDGMVNQIGCMTCHNGQKEPYSYKREVEK